MSRECSTITARVEVCSEGCGGVPDIQIVGTNAFDDILASEEVIWTFFLRVGDCTGLLGVTMESISSGEIGSTQWTGKMGVAVAAA